MAIELIPKKHESRLPGGIKIFSYASIAIFTIVVVVFVVLRLRIASAAGELQETRAAIERERTPERVAMEEEVKAYAKKINNFSVLLTSHYDTGKFFSAIERATHPRVWFSSLSLDAENLTVKLSGTAETFYALGQQIAILEQQQFFKSVNLSEIGLSKEGGASFSIDFSLDPNLFQQ